MPKKERVQCAIRLYEDTYKKVKAKVIEDKITVQILGELLYNAYLKNNKEVMRLVRKRSDERNSSKRRYSLDEIERDKLLRLIEEDYSPLRDDIDKVVSEMENEE